MSSQHSSQVDTSGALVPAIILFGGLTLLLLGLLASRPTTSAVTPASSNPTSAASVSSQAPEATAVVEATETVQTVAMALDPAKVKAGETSFQGTCSACHGFNAMGIPGLGKPLIGSKFVDGLTDDQLLAFLQVGREVTDPLNTTGVQMPARGGNPSFTDDKLMEIIAYIRSLNVASDQGTSGTTTVTEVPTSSAPVATEVPSTFVPFDLSSLPVPTSLSNESTGTTGAETTAVPSAEITNEPFSLPDLSSLPVPTSMMSGDAEASSTVSTAVPSAEITNEPFSLPDLSSLPVPTSRP